MRNLSIWFLFLFSSSLLAHQNSVTSSQREIKWNYTNIPLRIINNSASLPASGSLIEAAMAEWNGVSSFKIQKVSTSNNQIKFSNDFSMYGSAVVGVTEVNYNSSGVINSASILLNEQHYDFTSTPGMALGNQIYLKDVVTHELGHFIGLAHSEVLNSTMFYSTFPGQSELAADDEAGIRNKYESGHGKIYGYVKGGNQIGVLGVHVQAISRARGEAISGISDENGYFEIGGLDLNDTYYLYTSKLKNLEALPGYFANVQSEFCPASYVGSFFSACGRQNDGLPQGINITSTQKSVDVGVVSINCTMRSQEDYNYEKLQSSFSALPIFDYAQEPRWEKSYVGFFRQSELSTVTYTASDKFEVDLSSVASPSGKTFRLRLISQIMGNPLEYHMVVKKNGSQISGSPFQRSTNSPEGTFKLDLAATVALSATASTNIFEIEIKARKLSSSYAAYSIPDVLNFGSEQNLPYLLVMDVQSGGSLLLDTGAELSDNFSCLDAPFTYPVKKSTAISEETSATASGQGEAAVVAASCATLRPPSGPGPGSFSLVFAFGFFCSLLLSRFVKRNKNFLS